METIEKQELKLKCLELAIASPLSGLQPSPEEIINTADKYLDWIKS